MFRNTLEFSQPDSASRACTNLKALLVALFIGPMAAAPLAAQETAAGETEEIPPSTIDAVVSCAICHGPEGGGKQALGAPRIGGLSQWYLARQLEHFRQGIRGGSDEDVPGTQMRAVALTLDSKAEVGAMAQYYSDLEPALPSHTVSGDAERGKQLYQVCIACHGADGSGNQSLNAPAVRGQHDWYIVRQLEHYMKGLRGANPRDTYGAQMAPIVKTLEGHQDFIDIAAYINTLPADDS